MLRIKKTLGKVVTNYERYLQIKQLMRTKGIDNITLNALHLGLKMFSFFQIMYENLIIEIYFTHQYFYVFVSITSRVCTEKNLAAFNRYHQIQIELRAFVVIIREIKSKSCLLCKHTTSSLRNG